jgi:hypothetical protein
MNSKSRRSMYNRSMSDCFSVVASTVSRSPRLRRGFSRQPACNCRRWPFCSVTIRRASSIWRAIAMRPVASILGTVCKQKTACKTGLSRT